MSWFGGLVIQTNNSVPGNFETLTVSTSSTYFARGKIKPTSGTYAGMSAQAALVTLEGGDIRFRIDGLAPPTSTTGHYMTSGDTILIVGAQAVSQFRAIRAGDQDGYLTATYFF
jgi:hypothetical protein|uniref:Uncharacterized protein n=1 Tax=Desulfobacca acetoxidans TaxID=60893 RepID=A0A7C5AK89_9BACT